MKVLIYGLNFSPELAGIGKYTGEMAKWLADRDHQVKVITTPPYYPEWKISDGYSGGQYRCENFCNTTVFRTPLWVPKQPKTISRLLHMATFALSSIPILIRQITWHSDVIICIAPSFFCTPATLLFSTITSTPSVLHVQDFEIDAMFGLGMMQSNGLVARIVLAVERFIMRRFDRVSSISSSMCERLLLKGVAPHMIINFPNWVDTDFIHPDADATIFRHMWGFKSSDHIVLYSGNLGKKQGLEIVLETADILREHNNLHFVIVGDGVHKQQLVHEVAERGLHNIHFHPLQPYRLLPELLRMADTHLVIQKRGAADSVMPSKLTSIFAVGGHALITADVGTELGRLIKENPGIATLVEPENSEALTVAIRKAFDSVAADKASYNQVARKYAIEKLGREAILAAFEQELIMCVRG